MSLAYKFRKAERLLKLMEPADRGGLLDICRQIRSAQADLSASAGQQMERCIGRCQGICCRNIELDPIISHWDLVFILTLAPDIRSRIQDCLRREDPLYRTDCIFLENGKGPCMFPENVRPEVCVTTFCQDDGPIRREIQRVKRRFFRLSWYASWRTIRAHLRALARAATAARTRFSKTT